MVNLHRPLAYPKGHSMTSVLDSPVVRTAERELLPHRVNDAKLPFNPLHRYCADPNLAIFDGR